VQGFLSFVAAGVLLAGSALAADRPQITGADLVACRGAADQPICLLKLAAQERPQHRYGADIAVAYSPEVMAALGPDAPPANGFEARLEAPERAAVQALKADLNGAPPDQALAPIRAIPSLPAQDAGHQEEAEQFAANQRIRAYRILWDAGHGDDALPPAHRPSEALSRAILQAWKAELPRAADSSSAADLAAAYRRIGDGASAAAVAPHAPADRLSELIDAGRLDDAAALLDRRRAAPTADLSTPPARMEAAMAAFFDAGTRWAIIRKADQAGRPDVALRLAEGLLETWLDGPGKAPAQAGAAHTADGLQIAPALLVVVDKAPRAEAIGWVERMDAVGRLKTLPTSPISALAAMRAWARLGEPGRGADLARFWKADAAAALQACKTADFKTCLRQPAAVIPIGLRAQPLDTPWQELMPMADHEAGTASLLAGGPAGIEARLKGAQDPWARLTPLMRCTSVASEAGDLKLAAYCAHRLAAEPTPEPRVLVKSLGPIRPERVGSILRVARAAARRHDDKTFSEMMALAFDLAAKDPRENVGPANMLEDIAIAELRAQGRL
jgi:hypothetical protein